jgi:hypothetical protein
VGFPRELELAKDGTIYGATVYGGGRGQGIWTLGSDEKPVSFLSEFYGLFTRGEDGTVALAPADAQERRPRLELLSSDGKRSTLAMLEQINALAWHGRAIVVADGSAVRTVALDGATETLAKEVGKGIQGLAIGPNGPVVAAFEDRAVVEVARDGTRQVLLKSEPPWGPTDVTFHDGTLYVVEYAHQPSGWTGPRVRRVAGGEAPVTLLTIEDDASSFWFRLVVWTAGVLMAVAATIWIARTVRHQRRQQVERAPTKIADQGKRSDCV